MKNLLEYKSFFSVKIFDISLEGTCPNGNVRNCSFNIGCGFFLQTDFFATESKNAKSSSTCKVLDDRYVVMHYDALN